jgi:hypothetical protein
MSTHNEAQECRWESGALGLSPEHATPAPASLDKEVDDALGLQMISIRLPKQLIDDLKLIAGKENLGYQPLIRRVLLRFAEAEFRAMAHQRLTTGLGDGQSPASECEEEPEPCRAFG